MAVGAIVKEANLRIEEFTVKENEDIEKGEIVYNDGNGILAATSAIKGPFMVALKAHDYSEETAHKVRCGVEGTFEVQKDTGALVQGRYVEIGPTAGSVKVFDYSTPGKWYEIVGTVDKAAASAATGVNLTLRGP